MEYFAIHPEAGEYQPIQIFQVGGGGYEKRDKNSKGKARKRKD
jgi:hypothetical protein